MAERSELLAQELGKAVAGNHPPYSVLGVLAASMLKHLALSESR
jgi:hypothetical protein